MCYDGNVILENIVLKSECWSKSLLVIIPLRLGLNFIQPEYLECLKSVFTGFPSNVGIAGGKENMALYFVGLSNNDLIYLDPHFVQKAVPSSKVSGSSTGSGSGSSHPLL